jgi:tetratricopeptide (TPR) repeat protein
VNVNSPKGNADYTIAPPVHYPFYGSDSETLKWLNRQLIKAKPEFHKRAFLRPVHKTTEFCGTCHKVHLPQELNNYRWLRGQNHYDSFLLSGVSGQGVQSFYYPPKAEKNCNGCHMPQIASDDFGADDVDGELKIRSHLFPSANTAIPKLVNMENADEVIQQHQEFLRDNVRIDIFGIREGVGINGELHAPLGTDLELEPGKSYTVEVVIRTLKLGHLLTQGTVDSNELWLDLEVQDGKGRDIARSGAIDENGDVDPASHFVNAFVLDRHGNRIDRRNAQDIFVPLYNNQIAPGSAKLARYEFTVPENAAGPLRLSGRLLYRKFDSTLMRFVKGPDYRNDLPVSVVGEGSVEVAVAGAPHARPAEAPALTGDPPEWMRWNDYGIALLSAGQGADLLNAEAAFARVEALGNFNGPLNLTRVYLAEGEVRGKARESLQRARKFEETPIWTYLWLSGQLSMKNGDYDAAIRSFSEIVAGGFAQAENRSFDFSKDYRLLNDLGEASYLKALSQRRAGEQAVRDGLQKAVEWYDKVLVLDPENATAHWGLKQAYMALGQSEDAARHSALHQKYKRDDLAEGEAMMAARERYRHAAHASEDPVIYDLTPSDTYASGDAVSYEVTSSDYPSEESVSHELTSDRSAQ